MKRLSTNLRAAAAALLLALAAVLGANPPAYAGGIWDMLPLAGTGSNTVCVDTVNGVCQSFAGPGPTSLTGSETLPADTNLSGGRNPQSARYPFVQLGHGATQYSVPLAAGTIAIAASTSQVIIEPAGTLATLTMTLPAASLLVDGQTLGICTTQIITALTLTAGSGTTVVNGPTALLVPVATGAASCVKFEYVLSTTKWYRIQ